MSLKEHEYIRQTLERYTNSKLEDICDHVLITNFRQYIKRFKEKTKGKSAEGNFRIVNAKDIATSASEEFGTPLLDITTLDPEVIPKNLVDEKLIRANHAIPIFHRDRSRGSSHPSLPSERDGRAT